MACNGLKQACINVQIFDVPINYLDNTEQILTFVYPKPTNTSIYLNYKVQYPQLYEEGTVAALIHCTYKISSDCQKFNTTVSTPKQAFINNGYPN